MIHPLRPSLRPVLDSVRTTTFAIAIVLSLLSPAFARAQSDTATIGGQVTSTDGTPIPDARVVARAAAQTLEARTGPAGDFSLTVDAGVEYRLEVYAVGWEDRAVGGSPCNGLGCIGGTRFTLQPGETVTLQVELREAARLSGVVLDDAGQPLPDAVVLAFVDEPPGFFTSVAGDGSWMLDDLQPGRWFVRASDPEHVNEVWDDIPCSPCDLTTGTPIDLEPGEWRDDIDFALGREAEVSGRITGPDGSLVDAAEIYVYDAAGELWFAQPVGGEFTIQLQPGNYRLGAKPAGESSDLLGEVYPEVPCVGFGSNLTCDLEDGEVVEVEQGEVVDGIDFTLERGGSFTGRVTERGDDSSQGFSVTVFGPEEVDPERIAGFVFVDSAGGSYTVGPLLGGTYTALAERVVEGFSDLVLYRDRLCEVCDLAEADPIEVVRGEETTGIDFTFDDEASLEVQIVDADLDEPILGARQVLFTESGERVVGNGLGLFRLAPGRYFLAASAFGYFPEAWRDVRLDEDPVHPSFDPAALLEIATPIDVAFGDERVVTIELDAPPGITGRLVTPEGDPIPFVRIDTFSPSGDQRLETTTSRPDGRFRIAAGPDPVALLARGSNRGFTFLLWEDVPCLGPLFADIQNDLCPFEEADLLTVPQTSEVGTPGHLELGDWTLVPESTLVVRAEDAETGEPLSIFDLTLSTEEGAAILERQTREDVIRLRTLIADGYRLVVRARDYEQAAFGADDCSEGCTTFDGEVIELGVGEERELVVRLHRVDRQLELRDGRFTVDVRWRDFDGNQGAGTGVPLSDESGYFWFFGDDNVEMVIKVLDACDAFDRFWVFAAGLTNVEVEIDVTDTADGTTVSYANPLGLPFEPILDVDAFATCAATPDPVASDSEALPAGAVPSVTTHRLKVGEPLTLRDGRFVVEATWRDFDGNDGDGTGVGLTNESGTLWFFDPANVEVIVKVLDACDAFDRYWVFAAGLTNVGVTLEVTDTQASGQDATVVYENDLGTPFQPILDVDAFATCP